MHTIYDGAVSLLYKRAYPIQALVPTEANKGKTAAWDAIAPFDLGDAGFVPDAQRRIDRYRRFKISVYRQDRFGYPYDAKTS